jgi:formylglycine-generating enzyme required for sulfatase activity
MIQDFLSGTGLRLPTEAEWEYSYRAGSSTAFHSFAGYPSGTNDDSLVGGIAWFNGNAGSQTRPVGGKAANGFGLHDMSGNVWEWVSDRWLWNYYASSPPEDPQGPPSGAWGVLRGGSWSNASVYLKSSERGINRPYNPNHNYGFRVARNP